VASTRMPTSPNATAPGDASHGWSGLDLKPGGQVRMTGAARRRRLPRLVLGVVLVAGCSVGGLVAGQVLGHRESVLVLARPVTAGHVLSAEDVRDVSVSADSGLAVVRASDELTVVGRQIAYGLPAGAVLTRDLLGTPQVPQPGQGVAAVGLKAGQFPPGLTPGTRVAVLVTPNNGTTTSATGVGAPQTSQWIATVTAVVPDANNALTVVSLQLADADARALASAPSGQISVVAINGGGR
jgi:hypothetical protein